MLNVGICDDDAYTCENLQLMIEEYAEKANIKFQIEIFHNGDDLCRHLKQKEMLDVLFLDIELGEMNGVETGKFIREILQEERIKIIYISYRESYAMQLFKMRPIDFLIKPIKYKKLKDALYQAVRLSLKGKDYFTYQIGKSIFKEKLSDIMYFESKGRKISIFTIKQKLEFYGRMEDVIRQVENIDFIRVHKSYFINYFYVKEYQYEKIAMINGEVIAVSQSNRAKVRKMLIERKEKIIG